MPTPAFTHLETHSYYTLLGSTIPVADLVARAAAEGLTHLALADTNALYGAIAFNPPNQGKALKLPPLAGGNRWMVTPLVFTPSKIQPFLNGRERLVAGVTDGIVTGEGIGELALPPLEPRALAEDQIKLMGIGPKTACRPGRRLWPGRRPVRRRR